MSRFKLVCQYDGSNFHGWQLQKDKRTVQGELEKVIAKLNKGKLIDVVGSGRTDAGVHAFGQVAHFDLPEEIDSSILINALNAKLDYRIKIIECEKVNNDFHARYSATKRHYVYRLRTDTFLLDHHYTYHILPVDIDLLNSASKLILGEQDFTSFSKSNKKIINRNCHIYESIWKEDKSILNYHITGNRFLHHMVRYLVGTMLEIGKNNYSIKQFNDLLLNPRENVQIFKAPSKGLALKQVDYE